MSSSLHENGDAEERSSLVSVRSSRPSPYTLTKLVRRLRALTLTLLPVEVEPRDITTPTSRIVTPQVISAYRAAAGDFTEALPYCLIRARAQFLWDANHNPADYGENYGRAVACEVLARRIVHLSPPEKLTVIMSTRFQHRQIDGEESEMSSALEAAIDGHCTIFLSSTEAQDVVNDLWNGDLVQQNNAHHDIDYNRYTPGRNQGFWGHLDPSRLSVPRYQNIFRVVIWLFFLGVYSQAVREPLERIGDTNADFDGWELVLYLMAFSFSVEDFHKFFTLLRFAGHRAFSFWNLIAFITDSLFIAAFALRVVGMYASQDQSASWRLKSFQVLSFVSPFIWMKLVTVFDGYKYVGTMQICVSRMLKESGIFFALLSVLAIGFTQGLYALDAADGTTENTSEVVNVLVQALLQSPDYGKFSASPVGLVLFYFWNMVTAVILLNVLISLFSSAYSDIVEDAEAQYLAFFASKTIGMIRAPDSYVYPAPFSLIELVFVAPFEVFHMDPQSYATLNRYVMGTIFFIPLSVIALVESTSQSNRNSWVKNWLRSDDEGEAESPYHRDPDVDDPSCEGMAISKVPFEELIKVFPNTYESSDTSILKEISEVKAQLNQLLEKLQA